MTKLNCLALVALVLTICPPAPAQTADPYLWLEDVTSPRALAWVKDQDARAVAQLESWPDFQPLRERIQAAMDSQQRIPFVTKYGAYLYNFWRDKDHPRGVWRRTTMDEYKKTDTQWETVLDVDQLGRLEKESWVWHGEIIRKPDYDRCLILLSRGGSDAQVVREFDLNTRQFVADGFTLPEGKSDVSWLDRDTIYVATDFGPGSLTESGYPRIVKKWKRGTPLSSATTEFVGNVDDIDASPDVVFDHGYVYELIDRGIADFKDEMFVRRGEDWVRIDKPLDADLDTFGPDILLRLRSDWTVGGKTYRAGSLVAESFERYLEGDRKFSILFEPDLRTSLTGWSGTKNFIILNELENVCGRAALMQWTGDHWARTAIPGPAFGSMDANGVDPDNSDDYFLTEEDWLTPPTLYLGTAGKEGEEELKSMSAVFDSSNLQAVQYEAISKDGTHVPYFLVGPKGMKLDGTNPTLLYGYGGFEISLTPSYWDTIGIGWLARGGVFALANIRGGGEFGPEWHQAAIREKRQNAYDDFIAVSEDLINRKITSPAHLGIMGGSNGGLLMGVMLTQRPDLFGAVDCQSPLLDMRLYTKLLAGASWIAEYGDPDVPSDWAFMSRYSPYQNVFADRTYPPVFFTTSTRDDRVHPGHARKMAALMEQQGHDVLFYENIEGGHSSGADHIQAANTEALEFSFLWSHLQATSAK
jgi:prolyl oligopeptidase